MCNVKEKHKKKTLVLNRETFVLRDDRSTKTEQVPPNSNDNSEICTETEERSANTSSQAPGAGQKSLLGKGPPPDTQVGRSVRMY